MFWAESKRRGMISRDDMFIISRAWDKAKPLSPRQESNLTFRVKIIDSSVPLNIFRGKPIAVFYNVLTCLYYFTFYRSTKAQRARGATNNLRLKVTFTAIFFVLLLCFSRYVLSKRFRRQGVTRHFHFVIQSLVVVPVMHQSKLKD